MTDSGRVLACHALTRHFGQPSNPFVALDAIDLCLAPGTLTAVTGPSGCGKSTLLNLLGALDVPSAGSITLCGTDIARGSPSLLAAVRRTHVGFLFQDAGLIGGMTVLDNIILPLRYAGSPRRKTLKAAMDMLDDFGLTYLTSKKVEQLSGGERQRIALIRALVKRPAVLICDEPTAALDEDNSRHVVAALVDYAAGGGTVVCSTHDPIVLDRVTDRRRMARGRWIDRD